MLFVGELLKVIRLCWERRAYLRQRKMLNDAWSERKCALSFSRCSRIYSPVHNIHSNIDLCQIRNATDLRIIFRKYPTIVIRSFRQTRPTGTTRRKRAIEKAVDEDIKCRQTVVILEKDNYFRSCYNSRRKPFGDINPNELVMHAIPTEHLYPPSCNDHIPESGPLPADSYKNVPVWSNMQKIKISQTCFCTKLRSAKICRSILIQYCPISRLSISR